MSGRLVVVAEAARAELARWDEEADAISRHHDRAVDGDELEAMVNENPDLERVTDKDESRVLVARGTTAVAVIIIARILAMVLTLAALTVAALPLPLLPLLLLPLLLLPLLLLPLLLLPLLLE